MILADFITQENEYGHDVLIIDGDKLYLEGDGDFERRNSSVSSMNSM